LILLFLEFLGTTELMVILVLALLLFGPRKLPELGRTIGKSLGEFKRASEDFKRTWEMEVEAEKTDLERTLPSLNVPDDTLARYNPEQSEEYKAPPTSTEVETAEQDLTKNEVVDTTKAPRKQDWL
jgi:TatA/E family protein of Tat protein translocase